MLQAQATKERIEAGGGGGGGGTSAEMDAKMAAVEKKLRLAIEAKERLDQSQVCPFFFFHFFSFFLLYLRGFYKPQIIIVLASPPPLPFCVQNEVFELREMLRTREEEIEAERAAVAAARAEADAAKQEALEVLRHAKATKTEIDEQLALVRAGGSP